MCTCDFYRYEHVFTYEKRISKQSPKKIMQLVWTVVTLVGQLFNVEHGIEHDTDSAYGACMH